MTKGKGNLIFVPPLLFPRVVNEIDILFTKMSKKLCGQIISNNVYRCPDLGIYIDRKLHFLLVNHLTNGLFNVFFSIIVFNVQRILLKLFGGGLLNKTGQKIWNSNFLAIYAQSLKNVSIIQYSTYINRPHDLPFYKKVKREYISSSFHI